MKSTLRFLTISILALLSLQLFIPQTVFAASQTVPETLKIPVLGEIVIKGLSLPLLSIVFGLLDGFNPCAMWALVFLITLLLGMKDRKRMWILGTTFIVASAFIYFLFLSAWLNFFLIIGYAFWIRLIVGSVALGAGYLSLRDYFRKKALYCKVTGTERQQKIFERMKKATQEQKFLVAFFGIILLAFAVNLVELVCSAGLPAIYTQILSLSNLPTWKYYAYILIYILFFMIDDLFVFFVAMITLKAVGIQTRYVRFSRLIGGIIMLIIGMLLILKPEVLMFGY